jgi:hypothetical protein
MSSDDDQPLVVEKKVKKVKKRKTKEKKTAPKPRYSKYADMHAKEGKEGQSASEGSVSDDDRHLSDLSCVVSNDCDNSYDDDMEAIYAQSLCSQASELGFGTPIHKRRNKDNGKCAGSIFTGIVEKNDRKHEQRLKQQQKAIRVLDLDLNILRSPCNLRNPSLPIQRSPCHRPPQLLNSVGILQFSTSSTHEAMFRDRIVVPKNPNRMKLRKSSDHTGNRNSIVTSPQLGLSAGSLSTPQKAEPPALSETLIVQPTMERSPPSQAVSSLLPKCGEGVTSPPSRAHVNAAAPSIPSPIPILITKETITVSSDSSDNEAVSFRDAASQTSPIEQILTLQDLQRELKEFAKAFGF